MQEIELFPEEEIVVYVSIFEYSGTPRKVWRYQSDNQQTKIKGHNTTEKGQKYWQRSTNHYTEKDRSSNKNPLNTGFNSDTKDYTKQNTHNEYALDWNYKNVRYIPMILEQFGLWNFISMRKYDFDELLRLLPVLSIRM